MYQKRISDEPFLERTFQSGEGAIIARVLQPVLARRVLAPVDSERSELVKRANYDIAGSFRLIGTVFRHRWVFFHRSFAPVSLRRLMRLHPSRRTKPHRWPPSPVHCERTSRVESRGVEQPHNLV